MKSLEDVWAVREIVQGKDGCYFKGEKIEMKREREQSQESHKILLQFWGHKRPQSAPHVLLQQSRAGEHVALG